MLVIIYGNGLWPTWLEAVGATSSFWKSFTSIENVIQIDSLEDASKFPIEQISNLYSKSVLIPLTVANNFDHPKGCLTLVSSKETLTTFNNKELFYAFLKKNGLQEYCPKPINITSSTPEFPFMMKRLDQFAGVGVAFIGDQEKYDWAINHPLFKGHKYLTQEYIEGDVEYTTQVMCKDGEILWFVTFEGSVPKDAKVNLGTYTDPKIVTIEPTVIEIFRKIFKLANYNGPGNVNFKLRDGKPVIFECNARFGGSMFLPIFREQLKESIMTLLNNAYLQTDDHIKNSKSKTESSGDIDG
jgi:carbamoylphosphate synthase large subunit